MVNPVMRWGPRPFDPTKIMQPPFWFNAMCFMGPKKYALKIKIIWFWWKFPDSIYSLLGHILHIP